MAHFTFSDTSLSVFAKKKLHTIPREHLGYVELKAYLESTDDHDEDHILELVDMKAMVTRLTAGKVRVVENSVFYNGAPVHNALTEKLMQVMNAGEDAGPWARFLDNVMKNPDDRAKEGLYLYLSKHSTPLTEDGCFVAWKYVTRDFKSARTCPDGTRLDHTPGTVVTKDRKECDPDPNNTCSTGLHCCASPYLGGYNSNEKVVKVKVNPRDVVAVPAYEKTEKMRVCRYYVLEEVFSDAEIADVDSHIVTHDVSQMENVVPEDLSNLVLILTEKEFNNRWARTDWPEENDLVAKQGSYLIGKVIDVTEDSEDEGYFDDDGEWVDEDGETFWVFNVIWQNGIYEEIVMYESDETLSSVTAIPSTAEEIEAAQGAYVQDEPTLGDVLSGKEPMPDEMMAAIKEANTVRIDEYANGAEGGVTAQTFSRAGVTYTAREIWDGVNGHGQREFSRMSGIPRSTLQGWMSQISEDQMELDKADDIKIFEHAATGRKFSELELKSEVQRLGGQRAFAAEYGVPRSTLQGWLAQLD